MELFDFTVKTTQKYRETVENVAVMISDNGFYTEDYSELESDCLEITGINLIDEELLAKNRDEVTVHICFPPDINIAAVGETLRGYLDADGVEYTVEIIGIEEDYWSDAWKKVYRPTRVGGYTVVPSWEDYTPSDTEKIITLDPGMAFGTGTHESTQLCLEALEKTVKAGDRMLDIGTGSGILAIGGLVSGCMCADAFDIDPAAVKMSAYNVGLNGFSDRFRVKQGGADGSFGDGYDIITANIVADVIISIFPTISKLLSQKGAVILGGILNSYADSVIEAAKKYGFIVTERSERKDWVTLVLRRNVLGRARLMLTFAGSSLLAYLTDILIFTLAVSLLRDYHPEYILISTLIARVFSCLANYIINRNLVFRDKKPPVITIVMYAALATVILLSSAELVKLFFGMTGKHESLIKICVDAVLFFVNFTVQRFVIFRKPSKRVKT